MKLSDHDLRQIDEKYLESLRSEQLLTVSIRLLTDLKEARDRLNQNPSNSSRPPSSRDPWVVAKLEDQGEDPQEEIGEPDKVKDQKESLSLDTDREDDNEKEEKKEQKKDPKGKGGCGRKPGKQKGTAGYVRNPI